MNDQPELNPIQRSILRTFFAVQDHGHGSLEAQDAAQESVDLLMDKIGRACDVCHGLPDHAPTCLTLLPDPATFATTLDNPRKDER